jgi:hypothetical protein
MINFFGTVKFANNMRCLTVKDTEDCLNNILISVNGE